MCEVHNESDTFSCYCLATLHKLIRTKIQRLQWVKEACEQFWQKWDCFRPGLLWLWVILVLLLTFSFQFNFYLVPVSVLAFLSVSVFRKISTSKKKERKQNFFKAADSQSCKQLKCQYTRRSTPLQASSHVISLNTLTNTKPKYISSTFFCFITSKMDYVFGGVCMCACHSVCKHETYTSTEVFKVYLMI